MIKKKIPELVKLIRNYKPPFIDFSKQKVISHSQLSIFSQCQYRWGLRYRDGFKITTQSISLIFGISIHEVIQNFLTIYYNQSKASALRCDMEVEFKDTLRKLYIEGYKKNDNKHFSSIEEINEHIDDGINIIQEFKKKFVKYFSKKGWWLVGCEIPINYNILPNVFFNGSLDIVLYHEPTNTIEIIDLKTSTRTWYDKQKKDEVKMAQILLYKKLLADQFNFPIENIEVKFIILKRKINKDNEYREYHLQEFVPASGKNKISKSISLLDNFVGSAFVKDGTINTMKFKKNISKDSCMFCQFKDKPDICNRDLPKGWKSPFEIG